MESRLLTAKITSFTLKKQFTERLQQIEELHIEWFKRRPAIFDQYQHDSLMYHIVSEQNDNIFSCTFWKHTELPENIRKECVAAFKEIFGNRIV